MTDLDLFGDPARKPTKNKRVIARGYAYPPGTGPDGEKCGTCFHCFKKSYTSKPYYKCGLMQKIWGKTRKTDILFRSKACKFWEKKDD